MKEADEMRTIQMGLSDEGVVTFRNNVAQAVVGNVHWQRNGTKEVTLRPGDALVRNARVLHAGLTEGSGDLIGPTKVEITSEMVGRTVAVFTSIEVKRVGGKPPTIQQKRWAAFIRRCGGIAGVARNTAEALTIVRGDFGGEE